MIWCLWSFYPECHDWFYLYSLIGCDQCSQLMRLGLQGCPRKPAHSNCSLSFWPMCSFCMFSPLPSCLDTAYLSKKRRIGEGKNYIAVISYCLPLNWKGAMSEGRMSLSREVNLLLQSKEVKDPDLSNQDAICETSLNIHKRMTNWQHVLYLWAAYALGCLWLCKHQSKVQTLQVINLTLSALINKKLFHIRLWYRKWFSVLFMSFLSFCLDHSLSSLAASRNGACITVAYVL